MELVRTSHMILVLDVLVVEVIMRSLVPNISLEQDVASVRVYSFLVLILNQINWLLHGVKALAVPLKLG